MADVELDRTNEGRSGTEIQAQSNFGGNAYVFQADATRAAPALNLDGLRGLGSGEGAGVAGAGSGPVTEGVGGPGVRGNGGRHASGVLGYGGKEGGDGVRGIGGSPVSVQAVPVAGTGVTGRGGDALMLQARPGAGVVGLGTWSDAPHPLDGCGVGVFGVGAPPEPERGCGYAGVIGRGGGFAENPLVHGAGVVGVSSSPLPDPRTICTTGVHGQSEYGPGVAGASASGRGGVFRSERAAQAQLVPSTDPALPIRGEPGDLWVHAPQGGSVALFLCVQGTPVVQWQRVMLDAARLDGGTVPP